MTGQPRRVYVDTSAYLSILLDEEAWHDLGREVALATVVSSVLLIIETKRSLVRMARERTLTVEHYSAAVERVQADVERFLLRDLTLDLCDAHPLPAVATPHSLDLVHLHTALWFHAEERLDLFLTMDEAQRQAARELGLPVVRQ